MKLSIFEPRYPLTLLVLRSILLSSIVYGTASSADQLAQTEGLLRDNVKPVSVEFSKADSRMDEAKTALEQAYRQLAFAKASVRAAEAEFKAAKADKQALVLRMAAQELADVSKPPVNQSVVRQPLSPPYSNDMVDLGSSRLQGWDPSSPSAKTPNQASELKEPAQTPQGAPAPR